MQNTPELTATVREMHPDPFVQAAILRVYTEAPGLLDSAAYVALAYAEGKTPQQMLDADLTRFKRKGA